MEINIPSSNLKECGNSQVNQLKTLEDNIINNVHPMSKVKILNFFRSIIFYTKD